jgi:hypothetical protein
MAKCRPIWSPLRERVLGLFLVQFFTGNVFREKWLLREKLSGKSRLKVISSGTKKLSAPWMCLFSEIPILRTYFTRKYFSWKFTRKIFTKKFWEITSMFPSKFPWKFPWKMDFTWQNVREIDPWSNLRTFIGSQALGHIQQNVYRYVLKECFNKAVI